MSTYDDASLILYPSGYKEDKLYSLKPTDGSGDLTFTRASTATRVNAEGLIEKVRTNLLTYSNTFSNAAWTKTNQGVGSVAVVTPNYTTDPFGGNNAWRFQCNLNGGTTTNDRSWMLNAFTAFANSTLSIYIKLNIAGSKTIILSNGGGDVQTITNTDWVRINIVTSGLSGEFRIGLIGGTGSSDTLDCSIAFAQAEVSDFGASEYIPTTTAAVSVGMLADVPRIDYTGGGCGKLLLEPQRTNTATYSSEFDNAAWTKSGATITANNTTSPDGTTNADKIIGAASSGDKIIYQSCTVTTGQAFTISAFYKKSEYKLAFLRGGGQTGQPYVIYNLDTQAVVSTSGASSTKIEDYSNGWYRVSLTLNSASGSSVSPNISFAPDSGYTLTAFNVLQYTGDGTSGGYIYGAQCEIGSYSTSLIITTSTSVTRLADSASKTGISSLIGQTEGVVFSEFNITGDLNASRIVLILSSVVTDDFVVCFISGGLLYARIRATVGGTIIDITKSGLTSGVHKVAIGYAANDLTFYLDGVLVGQNTSASVAFTSPLSIINLGQNTAAINQLGDGIQSAILFKTRLTNDQLADLTGGNKTTFNALATFYGYQIL